MSCLPAGYDFLPTTKRGVLTHDQLFPSSEWTIGERQRNCAGDQAVAEYDYGESSRAMGINGRYSGCMHFHVSTDLASLAQYLREFMALVDQKRWFKRADQLANEIDRSMHLQKIVADYHWLEMHISHQWEVLQHERKLNVAYLDPLVLAALKFAATTVEVHRRLGTGAKVALEGGLVNALKAETGFASLYLELSLGQSLIDSGFDVHITDMEGTARYDLLYSRDGFAAEVECKSQSTDAGRQIHRKDFYRFLAATEPILSGKTQRPLKEAFVVTLASRLPSSNSEQKHLLGAISSLANDDSLKEVRGKGFPSSVGRSRRSWLTRPRASVCTSNSRPHTVGTFTHQGSSANRTEL